MRTRWRRSISGRLILLVFVASLVPASMLIGVSWYLNQQVRLQMEQDADSALNLAINLEQTLIDGRLTRMRERAIALAGHPAVVGALARGENPQAVLDSFYQNVPGADLISLVDPVSIVRGRARSTVTGDIVRYGGLIQQVLDARTPMSSVVVIPKPELAAESSQVLAQVRLPIQETPASTDPRAGSVVEDALALVGAAPVLDPAGRLLGAVLVSDILNNDHAIVDEVTNRSPQGMPIHATIALDGIRVTTTVPAVGGGKRAVGTLYSDLVMGYLREGRDYRGRAFVGGHQWQRTIYLPLRDPSGTVVAGPFVGVPESAFADLAQSHALTRNLAIVVAVLSLLGAVMLAYSLARSTIVRPLQRFTGVLTEGNLHARVEADETLEMSRLAAALNGMTDRIRQTVAEMARVSHGVKAVSDDLATGARQTAENAEAALQVAASALAAAERVGSSAQSVAGRLRELEVALARIDVGSEEQARALKHASQIVAMITEAVQGARSGLQAVLESTRIAVAGAQQARHSALRTLSTLELVRVEAQGIADTGGPGDSPERIERLLDDLEEGQRAASDCDNALRLIARATEEAAARLWDLAAAHNESGARAGAVSQQMTDIATVADETASHIRAMSAASRQVIGEAEAMAGGIESALGLVRRAEAHVTNIAEANRRLRTLSERIRTLAAELDQATGRFPQH